MILERLAKLFGQGTPVEPTPSPEPPSRSEPASLSHAQATRLLATYDAASSDGANANHWLGADGLAAWSANSAAVRQKLRNRARYEVANSSLASGIVSTLANDTIGTGPRLRIDAGSRQLDRAIERAFGSWARSVRLADKLRAMRRARCVDGEAFAIFGTNPALDPVSLDLRLYEADQVATPDLRPSDDRAIDGVRLTAQGDPLAYTVLRAHPGDDRALGGTLEYTTVPAAQVLHYTNAQRPGEIRGVPELTPSLGLFAILRRYTLAALLNAETAANLAGVLESDAPEGDAAELEPLDAMTLEPNSFVALPDGWKAKGFKGEQPITGFREFRREIVNEIARTLNMPLNVALASSQDYNFASGRLDHGVYHRAIEVERREIERALLDRIFYAWLAEASLVRGLIPGRLPPTEEIRVAWRWDAFPSGDPVKDASAATMLRDAGLLSLERHFASTYGADWEAELEQLARESEYRDELGLGGGSREARTPARDEAAEETTEEATA